jgi:hypothetical protein
LAQYATALLEAAQQSGSKCLPAFTLPAFRASSLLQDDFVRFDCMQRRRSGLDVLIREISLDLRPEPYPQPEDAVPDWSRPQTPWPSSQSQRPWASSAPWSPPPCGPLMPQGRGSCQGSAHQDLRRVDLSAEAIIALFEVADRKARFKTLIEKAPTGWAADPAVMRRCSDSQHPK